MLKKALRKEVTSKLAALTPEAIRASSLVSTSTIAGSTLFQNAKSIGVYMHMDKEMETHYLVEQAFADNKLVYLPRIENLETYNDYKRFPKQRQCLHFLSVVNKEQVEFLKPRGKYGIKEPEYTEERTNDLLHTNRELDILFLPAVAYTRDGSRLGHGAGFYDDFIKRYRRKYNKTPTLIGIGLPEQLVDTTIEMEDHDEPLDYIVVGSTFINCRDKKF